MAQVLKVTAEISSAEYLDGEKIAEFRSEFMDGFVFAMSGVSEEHNDITVNLVKWLGDLFARWWEEVKVDARNTGAKVEDWWRDHISDVPQEVWRGDWSGDLSGIAMA